VGRRRGRNQRPDQAQGVKQEARGSLSSSRRRKSQPNRRAYRQMQECGQALSKIGAETLLLKEPLTLGGAKEKTHHTQLVGGNRESPKQEEGIMRAKNGRGCRTRSPALRSSIQKRAREAEGEELGKIAKTNSLTKKDQRSALKSGKRTSSAPMRETERGHSQIEKK